MCEARREVDGRPVSDTMDTADRVIRQQISDWFGWDHNTNDMDGPGNARPRR